MTIQRAAKPAPRRPEAERSFAADNLYGTCEHERCDRQARMTCPHCQGEFCRWHTQHPRHAHAAEQS